MNASRANLHTIGHNIANIETPGFSRQVAVQQAANPLRGSMGRGMVGTGSQITSINQIRSQFLDAKFWSQNSVLGQFTVKYDIMTLVQGFLHEGDGVGISHEMDMLFTRMSELETNAHDMTYRRNFISSFESLGVTLNSTYSQLRQQKIDINTEIAVTVGAINSIGRQIQALNRQITVLELDGSNANDLRDQRAVLLDELSKYVNIEVREIETNPDFAAGRVTDPRESRRQLQVLIDGTQFISHFDLLQIEVRPRVLPSDPTITIARNPEELHGMYDVFWSNGSRFNMYSPSLRGELAGLIHLRDGNGGNHARFQTAATGSAPVFDSGTGQLQMFFEPNSRVDLGHTGMITIRQANGVNRHFHYTAFELTFNADGSVAYGTFQLYPGDLVPDPTAAFAGAMTASSGQTTSYMGIPYFMARLDELTRTLVRAFNQGEYLDGRPIPGVNGHTSGFDLNGNLGLDLLGFTDALGNWQPFEPGIGGPNFFAITASNFSINPAILSDPRLLALSTNLDSLPSNGLIVQSWGNIKTDRGLFREGRLGDFISAITGDLGITARQAENFQRSYTELMVTIENQRFAVMGVNMEEEVAAMLQHQLVFQAAARLFGIIDGIYDTLINRMGNW